MYPGLCCKSFELAYREYHFFFSFLKIAYFNWIPKRSVPFLCGGLLCICLLYEKPAVVCCMIGMTHLLMAILRPRPLQVNQGYCSFPHITWKISFHQAELSYSTSAGTWLVFTSALHMPFGKANHLLPVHNLAPSIWNVSPRRKSIQTTDGEWQPWHSLLLHLLVCHLLYSPTEPCGLSPRFCPYNENTGVHTMPKKPSRSCVSHFATGTEIPSKSPFQIQKQVLSE